MNEQKLSQCRDLAGVEEKILTFLTKGEGFFDSLILELHAIQRRACPAYGAFCPEESQPSSWKEIPAIPLGAFRHADIRCFPAEETIRTFHTSGTTGEGYGQHHFQDLSLYRAAALGGWQHAGLPDQLTLGLMAPPSKTPHSSLSCMAGWIAPAGNFFLGDWPALYEELCSLDAATTLFGTALGFLDFFSWLDDRALQLPPGSRAVETGGYKGLRREMNKVELYALFEARLGLSSDAIWNEYGMTEISSQFYTRGAGGTHSGGPWVRSLVIDPETNQECGESQTGVLRIFDLANTGSCCAIQTRDLAIRRGDQFELLGRDPAALPRGCSRSADEMLSGRVPGY